MNILSCAAHVKLSRGKVEVYLVYIPQNPGIDEAWNPTLAQNAQGWGCADVFCDASLLEKLGGGDITIVAAVSVIASRDQHLSIGQQHRCAVLARGI